MDKIGGRAKTDLPDLLLHADRALKLAQGISKSVSYSEDDNFGFVALCFLHKQMDHAHSIKLLVDEGLGRDAQLVARAMQETLASLLWIAQQPLDRASQWRGFAYVEDWRLMQQQLDAGEVVDPTTAEAISAYLGKHGKDFLVQTPRKPGQGGNNLSVDDPYYPHWRGSTKIYEVFQEVGGKLLYQEIYGTFSDWIHVGPKGMGGAVHRENKTVTWLPAQPSINALVLATSFQCLIQTLPIVDKWFGMNFAIKIQDLRSEYLARFIP